MADTSRKKTMDVVSESLRELLPYTNLGWQLLATVLLFFGAGYLIDGWLDTGRIFTVILAVVGIIFGLFTVVSSALKLQEKRKTPAP
jgi:F0F1-type ATP synthase assembly protein I